MQGFIVGEETEIRKLGGCREPFGWKETTKGNIQVGFWEAQFYIGNLESTPWQLLYLHSSGGAGAKFSSGFCQIFFQF